MRSGNKTSTPLKTFLTGENQLKNDIRAKEKRGLKKTTKNMGDKMAIIDTSKANPFLFCAKFHFLLFPREVIESILVR